MKHAMLHTEGKSKGHYFLIAIILMMSAFALTSCVDMEDTSQSMALSGEWRGDFGMYYTYVDGRGKHYTFDSYDTRLTFIPAYAHALHGRGTQIDYYEYGPYEYQYYKFSWSVNNGNIYLTYDYDHELDTRISNYRMTNDFFSGTFASSGTSFRLCKIADYYNWTPYVNIYGYDSRDDWYDNYPYYAPYSRSNGEESQDSTDATGYVLSRGRK